MIQAVLLPKTQLRREDSAVGPTLLTWATAAAFMAAPSMSHAHPSGRQTLVLHLPVKAKSWQSCLECGCEGAWQDHAIPPHSRTAPPAK